MRAGSRTGPPAAASCPPAATVADPVARDQPWGGDPGQLTGWTAGRLDGWQSIALAAAVAVATR
jgi:hypothetical protein